MTADELLVSAVSFDRDVGLTDESKQSVVPTTLTPASSKRLSLALGGSMSVIDDLESVKKERKDCYYYTTVIPDPP